MLPSKRRADQDRIRDPPGRLGGQSRSRLSRLRGLAREERDAELRVTGICDSIIERLDKLRSIEQPQRRSRGDFEAEASRG